MALVSFRVKFKWWLRPVLYIVAFYYLVRGKEISDERIRRIIDRGIECCVDKG